MTGIEQDPEECKHGMYPPEYCTTCKEEKKKPLKVTWEEDA